MENNLQRQFELLRPVGAVNEAAMFVENKVVLTQEHPPVYAHQLDQFVSVEEGIREQQISTELWRAADIERDKLSRLMGEVQIKVSKKSKGQYKPLDLKTSKWSDVMLEVQETSQRWKSTPGNMAIGRKCVERLAQDSGAFQAWLELLPAGDYGSSICGVFKLAVGAASRYIEVEESIFHALSELPEMMEGARKYMQIYQDHRDQLLERKTFDLYLSILISLKHIMQFFADSSRKRFFEPLTNQKTYKMALTKSLDDVRKQTLRIRDEAQQCLAARNARIDKNVADLLKKVDALSEFEEKLAEKMVEEMRRFVQSGPTNNNKGHVTQLIGRASNMDKAIISPAGDIPEVSPHGTRAVEDLLNLLDYVPSLASRDTLTFLQKADSLDDREKARALAVVESDKFPAWVAKAGFSSLLLVNGHCDLEAAEGPSPLSFVAAAAVLAAERDTEYDSRIFVVKYFCSLHKEDDIPSRPNPTAKMMASLVGQLLNQMMARKIDIDVSFLTKKDLKKVKKLNLYVLSSIFRELARQLPPKTVLYCILDEAGLYETTTLESDIDAIMRRLTRLTRTHKEIVFKLLVTCRGRSLDFDEYFKKKEILDLPVDIEVDDHARRKLKKIRGI